MNVMNLLVVLDSGWWWWDVALVIFGLIPTLKFSLGVFELQFDEFVLLESPLLFKCDWCSCTVLNPCPCRGKVGNAKESPSPMQAEGGGWSHIRRSSNFRPAWLLLLLLLLLIFPGMWVQLRLRLDLLRPWLLSAPRRLDLEPARRMSMELFLRPSSFFVGDDNRVMLRIGEASSRAANLASALSV